MTQYTLAQCPDCNGSGFIREAETSSAMCHTCCGSGRVGMVPWPREDFFTGGSSNGCETLMYGQKEDEK